MHDSRLREVVRSVLLHGHYQATVLRRNRRARPPLPAPKRDGVDLFTPDPALVSPRPRRTPRSPSRHRQRRIGRRVSARPLLPSAERHKADREGRERPAREELRETVRRAVAGAISETEFFDRLAAAGLLIRKRVAPSGDLLGYKVAFPDNRNGEKEPVFFAGSTLSPDLSLPRIRERFSDNALSRSGNTPANATASDPATARRLAATAAWQAMLVIDHGDDAQVAAHITAAREVLDALAKTSAAHTRTELREAAFAFERATRSHVKAECGHDRALRQAARDLVYSGPALGRGEDGAPPRQC